jgi:hypothetical protein
MSDETTMTATLDIDALVLSAGSHTSPAEGACVIELASYLAHEPWSDHPQCVCPVLASFLRRWNDALDNATRQRLKPYAARVIGTRGSPALAQRRAWMLADWLVREQTAAWLESAQLHDQAAALRALPELTRESVDGAMPVICAAQTRASVAWAAARDAAWDAAGEETSYDAARAKADAALAPVKARLVESAFQLLDRLVEVRDAD